MSRINHVDVCMDDLRAEQAKNAALAKQNRELWDSRWKTGLWVVGTLIFAAGSGPGSLKGIIEIFSHIIKP